MARRRMYMKKIITFLLTNILLLSSPFASAFIECKGGNKCQLGSPCPISRNGDSPIFILPLFNIIGTYACRIDSSSTTVEEVFKILQFTGLPIESDINKKPSGHPSFTGTGQGFLINHQEIFFDIVWKGDPSVAPGSVWKELSFCFNKVKPWKLLPGSSATITCIKKYDSVKSDL